MTQILLGISILAVTSVYFMDIFSTITHKNVKNVLDIYTREEKITA